MNDKFVLIWQKLLLAIFVGCVALNPKDQEFLCEPLTMNAMGLGAAFNASSVP